MKGEINFVSPTTSKYKILIFLLLLLLLFKKQQKNGILHFLSKLQRLLKTTSDFEWQRSKKTPKHEEKEESVGLCCPRGMRFQKHHSCSISLRVTQPQSAQYDSEALKSPKE